MFLKSWGEGASSPLLLYVLGGPLNVNYTSFPCPYICFTTLKQTFMIRLNDVSGTSRKIMFIIYFARGVSKTRRKNKYKKPNGFFLSSSSVFVSVCVCVWLNVVYFFGAKKELLVILFSKHYIIAIFICFNSRLKIVTTNNITVVIRFVYKILYIVGGTYII